VETGLAISNAREELGTGEFWKMVREKLKYSESTVKKLLTIGTDTRLMEAAEGSPGNLLPANWTILYALTVHDLRRRLDAEAEERRRLTAILADQRGDSSGRRRWWWRR
jgi:hypothetical protein